MSLKVKLISAITLFMLMLGVLIVGVLAASSQTLTMTGSVQFNVGDRSLYVKDVKIQQDMSGTLYDAEDFMPGYINGSFDMNIGEFTTENGNANQYGSFRIYFYIINTTDSTYNAVEDVELSETLINQGVTATASGEITPTTITEEDSNGNKVIDETTEHNGVVTLTIIAPNATSIDLSDILITIEEFTYEGFTFTTSGSTASLTGYNGTDANVVIPSTFSIRESDGAYVPGTDYTVTSIADGTLSTTGAFYQARSTIQSVIIPETITRIGNFAFWGCSSLTSIAIPSSVTSIGSYAFTKCTSLTSINIPEGVTSIGDYAFFQCSNLTSINIPEGVTSIGNSAFNNCSSLTSINIPEGVTSIGDSAFSYCHALAEVYNYSSNITEVAIGNSSSSTNGRLGQYAKVVYNPSDLTGTKPATRITTALGDGKVQYYVNGSEVIALAPAVSRSSLTTVELDNSTTEINLYAFSYCPSLTSIAIPSSVTSIGSYAFSYCSSLTSVNFGDNSQLTSIGFYAFSSCSSLTSITIPSSVTSIGKQAFQQCSNLTSVDFETTTGWGYSSSSTGATTPIEPTDLEDPATAAKYLRNTYTSRYWRRG